MGQIVPFTTNTSINKRTKKKKSIENVRWDYQLAILRWDNNEAIIDKMIHLNLTAV